MLDRANISVVDGERHLRAQEALLVEQNRTGRQRAESAKLLRNMPETQSLMMRHVKLLVSEIRTDGEAGGPAVDDATRARLLKTTRLADNEDRLIVSAQSNLAESRELLERVAALLLKPAPRAAD
jgi:hypothetical protein